MGLKCTSAHTSSPLLTPPVIPPCRLVRWWNPRPASNRGTSCTVDPRDRAAHTAAPISTPLTDGMLHSA